MLKRQTLNYECGSAAGSLQLAARRGTKDQVDAVARAEEFIV